MTLNGAIKQLHDLRCAEDMPVYYKPVIAEIINVLLMDAKEVRRGRWTPIADGHRVECSICGACGFKAFKYCPVCGSQNTEEEK